VRRALDLRLAGRRHRRDPAPALPDRVAGPAGGRAAGRAVRGGSRLSLRRAHGRERVAPRVGRPHLRLVGDGDRVRAGARQARALRRRAAARPQSELGRARPSAHGDAHPPRAGPRSAAGPRGRRPTPRRRAHARRRRPAQAQHRAARGVGVQLRPQRRGGCARDRADRRRAGRHRSARPPGVRPRRRRLRWLGWFAAVNAALFAIIGLRYLWLYAAVGSSVSWSYALVAYVGHLSALAGIPLLVLLVPVAALVPRARVVLPLGVVVASAGVALFVLDSLVFAENRYHLSVLTFTLLEPQTWAFLALYFVVALAIESMLAGWVWQRTARPAHRQIGRYLALALVACFVAAHLVYAWAAAHYDV